MNILKQAIIALRFTGIRNTLRAVNYALYRDKLDFISKKRPTTKEIKSPLAITKVVLDTTGALITFRNDIVLEIKFLSATFIRLTWKPGTPALLIFEDESNEIFNETEVAIRINRDDGKNPEKVTAVTLQSQSCILQVCHDGSTLITRLDGQIIQNTNPPTLTRTGWEVSTNLHECEHIYGLGQRASTLNLNEGSYRFWNSSPGGEYSPNSDPLYVTIPVYLGLHPNGSYLAFYANTHDGSISIKDSKAHVRFDGGALTTYAVLGSPSDLLQTYTALTGRPALPPRWALGLHQSRWGYQSTEELRAVMDGFEKHQLPLSAIHQDIDYMDGYRVFTVDQMKYRDLQTLCRKMAMRSIRLVTILDPGVKQDNHYEVYRTGLQNDHFVKISKSKTPVKSLVWPGWTAMPDFLNESTRDWWASHYIILTHLGVAGVWHDMNEPEIFAAWGEVSLPLTAEHRDDDRIISHAEAHNVYGHFMNKAGHLGLTRAEPQRRPWILSRSGWAGTQKYAWHWTADSESSWEALKTTIPMILNLGLSGYAYTGPDIGGFTGNPDAELFTRWFQLAAFLPFFRNHAAKGTKPREPWVYGEPYTSIIRNSILFRQKLTPYLYTLAWETSKTGHPLVRPLFWNNPEEAELWDIDDVFLLGDSILVAPILEPGQRLRQFALPPGRWYHFWSEFCLENSGACELPVSLQRIPIFIRGGTILPLEEGDTLELHIYPDENGEAEGTIYFDEGDGFGESGLLQFESRLNESNCSIKQNNTGKMQAPWRTFKPILHGSISEIEWHI